MTAIAQPKARRLLPTRDAALSVFLANPRAVLTRAP